jgi:hypothetical protein
MKDNEKYYSRTGARAPEDISLTARLSKKNPAPSFGIAVSAASSEKDDANHKKNVMNEMRWTRVVGMSLLYHSHYFISLSLSLSLSPSPPLSLSLVFVV